MTEITTTERMEVTQAMSDEALATRAQAGDREAFGELARRYESKLLRYANRLLASSDLEPADVVQEALIKAYVNLRSFDAGRRFSPWIYRITHNELVNAVRRQARELIDFYDFSTFMPTMPAAASAEKETDRLILRQQLDLALGQLPDIYREPLVLFAFEEMSYAEIGQVLKLPTVTVGVRINRGKKKLQGLCGRLKDSHQHV
jgi:RNA polymerase sigma-70 factor (ECF subfamily)